MTDAQHNIDVCPDNRPLLFIGRFAQYLREVYSYSLHYITAGDTLHVNVFVIYIMFTWPSQVRIGHCMGEVSITVVGSVCLPRAVISLTFAVGREWSSIITMCNIANIYIRVTFTQTQFFSGDFAIFGWVPKEAVAYFSQVIFDGSGLWILLRGIRLPSSSENLAQMRLRPETWDNVNNIIFILAASRPFPPNHIVWPPLFYFHYLPSYIELPTITGKRHSQLSCIVLTQNNIKIIHSAFY